MNQLFKFVNVREAKRVNSDYASNPTLILERYINEDAYQKSLFKNLNLIREDANLRPEEVFEKTTNAIIEFAKTPLYINKNVDFSPIFKKYLIHFDFLQANQKKTNLLEKSIENIKTELFDSKKKQWLSSDEKMQIVDNLLAQIIVFKNPELINRLSSIIKILNFAINIDSEKDKSNAIKLLKRPLIIPQVAKLPIVKKVTKQADDRTQESVEIKKRFLNYQNYLKTYDAIKNLFNQQKEIYASLTKEAIAKYEIGKINELDLQKLPSSSKSLLTELSIKVGASLSYALSVIEQNGREATELLAEHIRANNTNILIGGTPISRNEFQERISSIIQWNENETGGVIIGNNGVCDLKFPFKIANLRVVEQELIDYSTGEIAHIETTLQGELKDRSTRRLSRSEETFSRSYEKEMIDERDTQTTDRFQLEKETSKVIKEDTEIYVKGELSASYGPISLSVGAGYSNNTSIEESNNEALTFAKDVVQRSLQRVIEKTKEERITKTIAEFEEKNRHSLDNRGGSGHSVGIFRWLNKNYKVSIKTYDKRMILELMLPQPAQYHLNAFTENKDLEISTPEPIHPHQLALPSIVCIGTYSIKSHRDVNVFNHHLLAAQYGAEVEAYPQFIKIVGYELGKENAKQFANIITKEVDVPKGYEATKAKVRANRHSGAFWGYVMVGESYNIRAESDNDNDPSTSLSQIRILNNESDKLAISMVGWSEYLKSHIDVEYKLTDQAFEEWQIKTYNAIIGAYNKKKAAYDNALAEAKANAGIRLRGTNPAINKELIRTELKKGAIYLMSHCNPINPQKVNTDGSFDCCKAMDEGQIIKFLNGVFEWKNMNYELYDYFYSNNDCWPLLYNISDPDPLMNNFLRAGSARVLIPVQRGKEIAVANFITLGTPLIEDLLDMEILDVADEFIGETEVEPALIVNDYPTEYFPDLKPLIVPTTLTIPECSSGGIKPEKYLIRGEMCISQMKPIIPANEEEEDSSDEEQDNQHDNEENNDHSHE